RPDPRPGGTQRRLRSGACDGDRLSVDEKPALGFGEAAPDAVRLADAERVLEALGLDRALAADRLGLGFALVALVLALRRRRREEERRLGTAAGRAQLPGPFCHLDRHRPPSPGRAGAGDRIPLPCTRQGSKRAEFPLR